MKEYRAGTSLRKIIDDCYKKGLAIDTTMDIAEHNGYPVDEQVVYDRYCELGVYDKDLATGGTITSGEVTINPHELAVGGTLYPLPRTGRVKSTPSDDGICIDIKIGRK